MTPFDDLERQIEQLRSRGSANQVERRNLLLEIEEFISSQDYTDLSPDERNRLQAARKELISLLEEGDGDGEKSGQVSDSAGEDTTSQGVSSSQDQTPVPQPGTNSAAGQDVVG